MPMQSFPTFLYLRKEKINKEGNPSHELEKLGRDSLRWEKIQGLWNLSLVWLKVEAHGWAMAVPNHTN